MTEYNDIYDRDRNLTGRLHQRGTPWGPGEYGLVVCVWVYDGRGHLLLTRRAKGKSFAGTWENSGGAALAGETSLQAICRELREETGAVPGELRSLGELYPSPGYCGEIIHMWACRVADMQEQRLDPGEFLDVVKLPLEKAQALVMENKIPDAKTQVLILRCADILEHR